MECEEVTTQFHEILELSNRIRKGDLHGLLCNFCMISNMASDISDLSILSLAHDQAIGPGSEAPQPIELDSAFPCETTPNSSLLPPAPALPLLSPVSSH